jgi:hypothetical protein
MAFAAADGVTGQGLRIWTIADDGSLTPGQEWRSDYRFGASNGPGRSALFDPTGGYLIINGLCRIDSLSGGNQARPNEREI